MLESSVHFLQTNILPWGWIGVFAASVLEEVVAPIPSALVMMMSGFIFVTGEFSVATISTLFFKVALPGALGVTIGSYAVYFVARYGGHFLIEKYGKYLGLFWSDVEKLKSKLTGTRKDEGIIVIARILPFVPSIAVSAFCGILEMGLVKYFVITFIGTFIRGFILGVIGWQVGNVYEQYASTISSIENIVLISTILIVVVFIVIKYKGKLSREKSRGSI